MKYSATDIASDRPQADHSKNSINVPRKTFLPGQCIVTHGDISENYYIIESGSVVILKKRMSDELEQVEVLGQGDGFGEDALINETKQQVTVRALELTEVMIISKEEFALSLKPLYLREVHPEDITVDTPEAAAILDVRTEEEFAEEYIPGAINIPLDDLRLRLDELDRSAKYYVYCLAGSRSATAAFILQSKGFDASNIRGGIMSWPGETVMADSPGEKALEST